MIIVNSCTLSTFLSLLLVAPAFALPDKYAAPSTKLHSKRASHAQGDKSPQRLSASNSRNRNRSHHTSSLRLSRDSDRILKRAIELVEQAAPVPHHRNYRLAVRPIDGRDGKLAEYQGGTIVLDAAEVWSADGGGLFAASRTRDAISVVAHEIACHDPAIPLKHNANGALTNPAYTGARRINHYDRPASNGKVIRGSSGSYGWVITTDG